MERMHLMSVKNKKPNDELVKKATDFANSIRGRYIISQALHLAVKSINKRPKHRREPSNVQDMEYLLSILYPEWIGIHELQDEQRKLHTELMNSSDDALKKYSQANDVGKKKR
jgi:hypothetical protein